MQVLTANIRCDCNPYQNKSRIQPILARGELQYYFYLMVFIRCHYIYGQSLSVIIFIMILQKGPRINLPDRQIVNLFDVTEQSLNPSYQSNSQYQYQSIAYEPPILQPLSTAIKQPPSDSQLDSLLQNLKGYLSNKFYRWQINEKFVFELPASSFDQKRQKPLIKYMQPDSIQDQLEVAPLSDDQLQGIKQDGTFTVNSKKFAIPYKWTISEWIYKGKKKTYESFESNMGTSFSLLYQIKQRFNSDNFSIVASIINICYFIVSLFKLVLGLKSVTIGYKEQVEQVMEFERHRKIYLKYWPAIEKAIYDYLNVPIEMAKEDKDIRTKQVENRKSNLRRLQSRITAEWGVKKQQILDAYEQKVPKEQLKSILSTERRKLSDRIYQESGINLPIINHLFFLADQQRQIQIMVGEYQGKRLISQTQLRAELQKQFSIRKYCNPWFQNVYAEKCKMIEDVQYPAMLDEINRRLKCPYFPDYMQFLKTYDQVSKPIRKSLQYQTARRTFTLERYFFPPYRSEFNKSSQTYYLVQYETINVDTKNDFWKIKLYCVRYYTFCINTAYYLFGSIVTGPLGLGVLFGCKEFYPEYIINSYTGQLGRAKYPERVPIAIEIVNSFVSVSQARTQFENAPDNGFFGKVCARICNIIYCYVFVIGFYIFIFLIFIKPLLILLNVVISLTLALTVVLWMPLVLTIIYVWNLLIYQHDDPNYGSSPCFLVWFPLISIIVKLVLDIVLLVVNIVLMVLMPILSILMVLLAIVRYITRRMYDFVMYIFIRCCARSPVQDTWIAWKIGGPGVSRNYFQTIKQADIYILVLAELEKIQVELCATRIKKMLQEPNDSARKLVKQIETELRVSISSDKIVKSVNYYIGKLDRQISQRNSHYPGSPGQNVRFTQEEIDLYTANCKELIENFMRKNPEVNLFEYFSIKKQNMENVVAAVWQRIFYTEDVFDALDNIDSRFEVIETREVDEVSKMMEHMKKEVKFSKSNENKARFNYRRKNKVVVQDIEEPPLLYYDTLNQLDYCMGSTFIDTKNTIKNSILINPNIKRIIDMKNK